MKKTRYTEVQIAFCVETDSTCPRKNHIGWAAGEHVLNAKAGPVGYAFAKFVEKHFPAVIDSEMKSARAAIFICNRMCDKPRESE